MLARRIWVDWSNPISKSLDGAWILQNRSTPFDLVTRKPITDNSTTYNLLGAISSGTTSYVDTNRFNGISFSSGTIAWSLYPTFAFNDGVQHFIWGEATNPISTPEFTCQKYSDNNWYVGWNNATGDFRVILAASSSNLTQNTWQHYAFTWGAGGSILYRNGLVIGTKGTVPTTTAPGNSFGWLCAKATTLIGCSSGSQIGYGLIWLRAITQKEVFAIYKNPYSFLQKIQNKRKFKAGGAVGPTTGRLASFYAQFQVG